MTTTTNRPKHLASRSLRSASMEVLGFIDTDPETASWNADTDHAGFRPQGRHTADPFADWVPTDVTPQLTRRRVRWGMVLGVLLVLVGLAAVALWVYRQPIESARAAETQVDAAAMRLAPQLDALAALDLTDPNLDPAEVTRIRFDVDSAARDLFEASGFLPSSAQETKATAADAAGRALEASRMISDAAAYKTAVLPALMPPALETAPGLITLEEAAQSFSTWQTGFDRVRSALPDGSLSTVAAALDEVGNRLAGHQRAYLDALRNGDETSAAGVLNSLATELNLVAELLMDELASTQTSVADRLTRSQELLTLLVG